MKRFAVFVVAVLLTIGSGRFVRDAEAAVMPAGIGKTLDGGQPLAIEEVRWGHRGGGFGRRGSWGYRGGFHRRAFYGRPVYRRAHVARRHAWIPYRATSVYYGRPAYGWRNPCIRRTQVWNGWEYVWHRYRVC